jgi:hypothetical protein
MAGSYYLYVFVYDDGNVKWAYGCSDDLDTLVWKNSSGLISIVKTNGNPEDFEEVEKI